MKNLILATGVLLLLSAPAFAYDGCTPAIYDASTSLIQISNIQNSEQLIVDDNHGESNKTILLQYTNNRFEIIDWWEGDDDSSYRCTSNTFNSKTRMLVVPDLRIKGWKGISLNAEFKEKAIRFHRAVNGVPLSAFHLTIFKYN